MKTIKYVSPKIGPKAWKLMARDRQTMFSAHPRIRAFWTIEAVVEWIEARI